MIFVFSKNPLMNLSEKEWLLVSIVIPDLSIINKNDNLIADVKSFKWLLKRWTQGKPGKLTEFFY